MGSPGERILDAHRGILNVLDDALADPAYQRDVRAPAKFGGTLLEQIIEAEGAPHPPMPLQPLGLLEHVCRGR